MDSAMIISFLSLILLFLCLIFCAFLVTVKTANRLSNLLLAGYILVIAIDISAFFYSDFITFPPGLEMLRIRLSAFKNPLLFLYVLSVIYSDFRLRKIHLVHTLPFLIPLLILIPRFILVPTSQQIAFFENYRMMPEIKIILGTGDLIFTVYMVAIIYYLRRYKKILLENYASNVPLSIYKWLAQLMAIIITISVLTKIKDFSKFSNGIAIINNYRIIVLLGGITFITWLVLRTLHIPDTFRGVDSKIQLVQNRAKKNDASDEEIKSQIERIRKFMNEHQPYLNPSLTIKELAQEMEMSERGLSILINHHMNQHFFDFINEYRIRKSMKLLKDNGPKDLAIKEIMFMVGFSSKNSFNTAFKKISQMTPTQYRNLQKV